jgi:hypothetical protein
MRTLLSFSFLLVLVGCASSGGREKVRDAQQWISREEVQQADLDNLYVIVQQLRPRWFSGGRDVVVFQNRSPMGGLDALRAMDPRGVHGLEWMDPFQAAAELPAIGYRGADGLAGVIVVWTRPPGE